MVETLRAILTDVDARDNAVVEANLITDTSAGTPWVDAV